MVFQKLTNPTASYSKIKKPYFIKYGGPERVKCGRGKIRLDLENLWHAQTPVYKFVE